MTSAPIFVVGPPRSGTTLTATVLNRHPSLFVGGENHFFEDIFARRRELGSLESPEARGRILERLSTIYGRYNQNEDQAAIERLMSASGLNASLEACRSYRDLLSAFMEAQAREAGKSRWGNNTPKDIFHAADILEFYPDAKFLACVRDPRDFLLSYKNRWKATTDAHRGRLKDLYHPVVTSLVSKSTVKRFPVLRDLLGPENFMVVRYEALVTEPERVVREICRVVGVSYEPDMLKVDRHNSSDAKSESGIFSSSVGSWRERLGDEEAYIAERLNRRELLGLGYALEAGPVDKATLARLLGTAPGALIRALGANAEHRGPLLPYLGKRVRALLGAS